MFTIKVSSQLKGILHVRELRQSLAEAAYRRSHRLHRTSQEKCATQARRIDNDRSQLPEKTAGILSTLAHRPVNLREIEDAHSAIRKLHEQIKTDQVKLQSLQKKQSEAHAEQVISKKKFSAATRRLQKLNEIDSNANVQRIREIDEQELAESEDRPFHHVQQGKPDESAVNHV